MKKYFRLVALTTLFAATAAQAETMIINGSFTPGYSAQVLANRFMSPIAAFGDNGEPVRMVLQIDEAEKSIAFSLKNTKPVSDELKDYRINQTATCDVYERGTHTVSSVSMSKAAQKEADLTDREARQLAGQMAVTTKMLRASCFTETANTYNRFDILVEYGSRGGVAFISRDNPKGEDAFYDVVLFDAADLKMSW